MPRLGGLLAFAAVASLGLPGLAGFWGEMLALLGAFDPAPALPRGYYLLLMALAGVGVGAHHDVPRVVVRRVAQGTSFRAWTEAVLLRDATTHELAGVVAGGRAGRGLRAVARLAARTSPTRPYAALLGGA